MSETLRKIMKHWTKEDWPREQFGFMDMPFNIEEFCREVDDALSREKELQRQLAIATEALKEISGAEPPYDGMLAFTMKQFALKALGEI